MARFVISYEFAACTTETRKSFLAAAEREGLLYVWPSQTAVSRLPASTLWGLFSNKAAASSAFRRAMASIASDGQPALAIQRWLLVLAKEPLLTSDARRSPDLRLSDPSDFETCRLHQLHDPLFN